MPSFEDVLERCERRFQELRRRGARTVVRDLGHGHTQVSVELGPEPLDNRPRGATLDSCSINDKPLTHYVVTRSDLPLGFLAAQVAHAAGESSPGNLDPGTYAVVLDARSEQELAAVERRLQLAGIAHVAVREPDAPYLGALTAIGLVPVQDRATARRALSSLPLLGKRTEANCEECYLERPGRCPAHRR